MSHNTGSGSDNSSYKRLDIEKFFYKDIQCQFVVDLLKKEGDFLLRRGSDGGKITKQNGRMPETQANQRMTDDDVSLPPIPSFSSPSTDEDAPKQSLPVNRSKSSRRSKSRLGQSKSTNPTKISANEQRKIVVTGGNRCVKVSLSVQVKVNSRNKNNQIERRSSKPNRGKWE